MPHTKSGISAEGTKVKIRNKEPRETKTKRNTRKPVICVQLETGTHCISAELLSEAQLAKYGDSASHAVVDRRLPTGESGMVARALHKVLERASENRTKSIKLIDATPLSSEQLPKPITVHHRVPQETLFSAEWLSKEEAPANALDESANAFGGFGTIRLSGSDALEIPVIDALSTPKWFLDLYGVKVVHLTEETEIDFGNCYDLMSFEYDIHVNYFNDYVQASKGGGIYLETHPDFPHTAIPLDKHCGGSYTVARKLKDNTYAITSVKVRYGYGLIIAPGAIHDDATLHGRYIVGLTTNVDPENVDTALMRTQNGLIPNAFTKKRIAPRLSGDGFSSIAACRAHFFAEQKLLIQAQEEKIVSLVQDPPSDEVRDACLSLLPLSRLWEVRDSSEAAREKFDEACGLVPFQPK